MPVSTRSQSSSSPTAIRARFTVTNEPNNKEQANTVQSINGLPPPSSLAGTAHFANLRSLSNRRANIFRAGHEKGGEAEAIGGGVLKKHTETKHVVKLSHDSVSLLTSRVVRSEPGDKRRALSVHSRRNSTVGVEAKTETQSVVKIKDTFSTDDRMQENLETPLPSHCQNIGHQVLGNYNWAREADGELQLNGESTTRCSSRPLMATKAPFSCPKPMLSTDNAEMGSAGFLSGYRGQTDLKPVCRVRKRPFNEELETVREEEAQGQASRIMVYVRLRPMAKKEKEAGARSCVRVVNKRDVYLTEFALETDYLRLKRLKGRHFAFDAAFPDTTGQQEVYNTSTAELVEGVLQGRNGSVFCYGATGAGKTYTMLGTVQNPGVMVLALKDLFLKLRQRSREGGYLVRLSYLEVYNESVRDLLSPGRPLVLREDSKQGIVAAGLTQYEAYSADEVMALLQQGNQNRTTEPTRVNETSSRSHAILQVVVEYKVQQDCLSISRMGKLSLIDLAGSERALATDQRTLRSLEGANINRSLLALSSCINALVEGKKHIPFRNSKLTQLLKDSLGGACQTSMIANISPSNLSFGETQNTLHWADRAKEIRTKACIANEELQVPESESEQAKVLLEVQKENQQLRMQLARLQQKLLTVQSNAIAQSPSVIGPPNPCPSSPFTPLRPERAACSPICRTPEPNIYREEDKNAESRTIQELQNTVQVLEKEKEQMRRDSALREEQLAASIAALNREHSVQLRHKELFIRTLCQKTITESSLDTVPEKPSISKSPSQQEQGRTRASDTVATTRVSRRMSGALMQGTGTPISTAPRVPSDRQRRFVTPKVSTKPCPLPRPGRTSVIPESEQQRTRAGRLSRTPQVIPKTTPLPRFCSPSKDLVSSSRKRTFWDITNANSPSSAPSSGRCTRSNIATSTPSMLLQPGFLRGRPSLN